MHYGKVLHLKLQKRYDIVFSIVYSSLFHSHSHFSKCANSINIIIINSLGHILLLCALELDMNINIYILYTMPEAKPT